jgi:ketosteroid isomerase-like protein
MSQENVELVRKEWKAWMAGSPYELGNMSWIDTDVVYDDDILPDHVGETYHGHAGMRKAWGIATEPWENFKAELDWARDAGEEVVSCHRARGRGKESGIEMQDHYAYVWRFKDGKVVYLKSYRNPDDALKAAGLLE